MNNALEIDKINYTYQTKEAQTLALENVSFCVEKGSFISIVGPSGCGKSTLLNLICGIEKADSGEIVINDNLKIGYMLQHDHLFEWRSVYRNVLLGLEIRKQKTPSKIKLVNTLLSRYGLMDFRNSNPSELSGGMRQRAALIRTLALEPDILLLDEPFSALDYQTRLTVCDDIASIIKSERKTAILVTHDLAEAISVGDSICVLTKRPGKIKKIIPVIFKDKNLRPMERRNCPEFNQYFNMLWKEL